MLMICRLNEAARGPLNSPRPHKKNKNIFETAHNRHRCHAHRPMPNLKIPEKYILTNITCVLTDKREQSVIVIVMEYEIAHIRSIVSAGQGNKYSKET